jgi:hypothetical protein
VKAGDSDYSSHGCIVVTYRPAVCLCSGIWNLDAQLKFDIRTYVHDFVRFYTVNGTHRYR